MKIIRGEGKGGGGGTPTEEDDTLQSVEYASVLDLLSEGEIQGLDTGDEKSIFLDGTPILNENGVKNFENYSSDFRAGVLNQPPIALMKGTPVTHRPNIDLGNTTGNDAERIVGAGLVTINDTNIDAVRVTISLPRGILIVEDDGDIRGYSVKFQIEVKYDNGNFATVFPNNEDGSASTGREIKGKCSSVYKRDYRFALSSFSSTCQIRVSRVTKDTDSQTKKINNLRFEQYVTIVEEKFKYPFSALSFLRFDSRSFGNIPTRKYKIRGIKVQLPSNASVDTTTHIGRVTYSGVWNGSFGAATWCNDPAWCLWDLMTNERYGAGIPVSNLDKWDFYSISQYCNELVPDGRGGEEPRFSCNLVLNEKAEIYNVIATMASIFRGISYYASGSLVMLQDKVTDSQYALGPSNVIDGLFTYSGTAQTTRHTSVSVAYQSYDALGEIEYENVEDADLVSKFGIIKKEIRAIGCYSQGQAHRIAKWTILAEQYLTETVSFSVSVESGMILKPGMVIDIADPTKGQYRRAGLVSSSTTTVLTADSRTGFGNIDTSENPRIIVMMPTGIPEERVITHVEQVNAKEITVSPAFSEAPNSQAQFVILTDDILTQQYRVVGVTESDGEIYGVTALKYNSTIYDAVEKDLKVQVRDVTNLNEAPPAVTNIDGEEFLYQRGQSVFVGFNLSWTSGGGNTNSFRVDYRMNTENWTTVTTTSPNLTLEQLRAGQLYVKVRAVSYTHKSSEGGTAPPFPIEGKLANPADVQNLTFEPISENSGRLRWDQSVDLDVKVGGKVFIRHSNKTDGTATWSNSVDLIDAKAGNATEAVVPNISGEIIVKFGDSSGKLSLGEASVIVTQTQRKGTLTIKNDRQDLLSPTPFSGGVSSKTNVTYNASSDVLELSVSNNQVASSGTYEFDSYLDLGHVYPIDIERYIVSRGATLTDLMNSWPDVNARTDWDGYTPQTVNGIISIYTTNDDPASSPTWSAPQPLASGVFKARAFKFKLDLTSGSVEENILVDGLGYNATLEERLEHSDGYVASGTDANGKSVAFGHAFFTGNSNTGGANTKLPSVGIVAANMQSGDFYNVTAVSATGFTVIFKNGSSTVDRNFYWTAVGYGKRG